MLRIFLIGVLALGGSVSGSVAIAQTPPAPVKKSTTGICHAPGTTYYDQTKNFTPFKTLEECLKSGGRLPKR